MLDERQGRAGALVLAEMSANIMRGSEEGSCAPGYYPVLFEDPDGNSLGDVGAPRAGLFAAGASFDPEDGYA
jgi:hypothetical protein